MTLGALVSEEITLQPTGNVVPEPATAFLATSGLAVLGALSRQRRRR